MPIVLINIFGIANTQKNVKANICISRAVEDKIADIVPETKRATIYIQSERPNEEYKLAGLELRKNLGISVTDTLLGRIGRADDGIFDPIGINAFAQVVSKDPSVHYLIMSPPPILVSLVRERNVPNVHFLPPSGAEKDVWGFHYAIDALAHFRLDGESFGLNIAESMLAGKPIITHKSHIWNAHLEYLDPKFSFVCEKDDVAAYAESIMRVIAAKKDGSIAAMNTASKDQGEKLFLIENSIGKIEGIIDDAIL